MLKNQAITIEPISLITNNKTNKITTRQNYNTPGVYKEFTVKPNYTYIIDLPGYNNPKESVQIELWFADRNNKLIEWLGPTQKNRIEHSDSIIKIGVFFKSRFSIGDYYLLDDIHLVPNHYPLDKTQCYISKTLAHFAPSVFSKYPLKPYKDNTLPTFFFGCYNQIDVNTIANHHGPKAIIWGGSDIMRKHITVRIKPMKDVTHIAQSSFIIQDLNKMGLPYLPIPFSPTVKYDHMKAVRKGHCVYAYINAGNPRFFGIDAIYTLKKHFKDVPFIITSQRKALRGANKGFIRGLGIKYYPPNKMPEIYKKCFIGLRLTGHDGISGTIQEMGLMGIKTIHNGVGPSCIPYKNYTDLVRIITKEREKIGTVDVETANRVRTNLENGDKLIGEVFYS